MSDQAESRPVLALEHVSFSYASGRAGAGVRDVSLRVHAGEVVLLCGPSGCGKTTVTRLANGLAPAYYEGALDGSTTVCGRDVSTAPLYETARSVGSVFQNPKSQFFSVDVKGELAFGCENQGMERSEVERRVAAAARAFDLEPFVGRSLFDLSSGQKQRIACASATAAGPTLVVLDEPSSNLDFPSIAHVRAAIERWKNEGRAVLVAEHRLHYLADLADRVHYLRDGAIEHTWTGTEFRALGTGELAALGLRALGLDDAFAAQTSRRGEEAGGPQLELDDFSFAYRRGARGHHALDIAHASLPRHAVTAVIGANGAGKSTFAAALCGLNRCAGTLSIDGKVLKRRARTESCFEVMQEVNHQLFAESVLDEVLLSMAAPDEAEAHRLLAALDLDERADDHPLALSGGQKQRACIASALASKRDLIVYDEPTSGLDLHHMLQVARMIARVREQGAAQLVITHDPEFILACCTWVVRLDQGRIVESYPLDHAGVRTLHAFFA
ncbi:ABC transporter ATP-binding protein [Eggerthella sinensis]|uniref:ABC transporter ATP-binding protein n=1 Tax=Eggerthella sinensis TaxID=242230 RepID=UPI001D09261A|nr:ABC transporter ATP-binding protein [Eggerthella sinensis]MCB7037565.1 ABC transporter ATP-binding protein [Eggerthella sinensis]